jgi:hypothetical protein
MSRYWSAPGNNPKPVPRTWPGQWECPGKEIVAEISRLPLAVPGSLTDRMTRCQRDGCHCKADPPRLHGPYPTWTQCHLA